MLKDAIPAILSKLVCDSCERSPVCLTRYRLPRQETETPFVALVRGPAGALEGRCHALLGREGGWSLRGADRGRTGAECGRSAGAEGGRDQLRPELGRADAAVLGAEEGREGAKGAWFRKTWLCVNDFRPAGRHGASGDP